MNNQPSPKVGANTWTQTQNWILDITFHSGGIGYLFPKLYLCEILTKVEILYLKKPKKVIWKYMKYTTDL